MIGCKLGNTMDHLVPVQVAGLDGLVILRLSAGDDHSIAITGDTMYNRQVYSWGLGTNG